jgi:hypothetical protein
MSTTFRPHPRHLLAIVGVAAALALFAATAPVEADPLPLSPEPTATLSCDSGVSVLTIHWPVGAYGAWEVGDNLLGDLSGPGGVFAAPTDESYVVPSGWVAHHSTVRLNLDAGPDSSYNQYHLAIDGESCPFSTPVSAAIACSTRSLSAFVEAGHVTQMTVYDQDGALVFSRNYPRYNLFGVLVEGVHVGPDTVTVPTPLSSTVTSVRVELTVDNTVLTTTADTSCAPAPPPPPLPSIDVAGEDGGVVHTRACDGHISSWVDPGAVSVRRTGDVGAAADVQVVWSGPLAVELADVLPATVHFDPTQTVAVVAIPVDVSGVLGITVVGGSGYLVGSEGATIIHVSAKTRTTACPDDPPAVPTTVPPGDRSATPPLGSASGGFPGGVPGDTSAATPAQVVSGTAHLTG